jgi:hypothetical protein
VASVLEDCLFNIVSDTVLKAHREEKMARMQSAAILAVQAREKQKAESAPGEEPSSTTTAGAVIEEDNRIFLHANPLQTTSETICLTCRLPRLNHPITGKGSRATDNIKKYCPKHPYIDKDGCDIYGKPLAIERPSKKKAAKAKANNGSGSGSDSGNEDQGGKKEKSTAMPSAKCPTCPRYLYFSRIAHHLERCSGIGGRASSRNAKEKLNSNTPKDSSRASTPKPGSQGSKAPSQSKTTSKTNGSQGSSNKKRKKGSDDEDDENERTPVKKKKLGKKDGKGKAVHADVARVRGAEKRLPGAENSKSSTPEVKSED